MKDRKIKVIVVANTKGGAGKSTVALHLAVQATLGGSGPVVMMDIDVQGSTTKWWNAREQQDIAFADIDLANLPTQINDLESKGFTVVVIDTPPLTVDNVQIAIAQADLVVVPTRPSPMDLLALGPTVNMCAAEGKRPLFVINGAAQRARITVDTATALSQHGAVSSVVLFNRTDYATGIGAGLALQELDASGKGAQEVAALWDSVKKMLFPAPARRKEVVA